MRQNFLNARRNNIFVILARPGSLNSRCRMIGCYKHLLFEGKTNFQKKAVFWDMAPCRHCVNRRFGGTYRLHLQDRRKKEKIRKRRTSLSRCSQYLHGATSQNTAFFIATAVKTSNVTKFQKYDCIIKAVS
jgi:hypothetical protein